MNTSLLHLLAANWTLVLLRGVLAIAFGVLALIWPALTLLTLVVLFGTYAIIDGCVALVAAFRGQTTAPRWWLVLIGVLGIAAGIVTFAYPGLTTLMLLMCAAALFIVRGILEIAGAIHLRREIQGEWFLVLSGITSTVFGILLALMPGVGALAVVWMVAATAIIFGIFMCSFAFRLRYHRERRDYPDIGTAHPA